MSQWITLEEMMSKYGIDKDEALYWTSIEGISHSEINGLVLIDNDSISTYLDANKICSGASEAHEARSRKLKRQDLLEELIENQKEMCATYLEIIERQKTILNIRNLQVPPE